MNRKILLIPMALFVLASMTVVLSANPYGIFEPGSPRSGFDPLSQDEMSNAVSASLPPELRSTDEDNAELLLVERHREAKSETVDGEWDRRADVFYYDYNTDETTYSIVNLETGNVDEQEILTNIQLQITAEETDRALDLVLQDTSVWEQVEEFFSYFEPDQVLTKSAVTADSFTFRAASEGITDGPLADCGRERCADLFLYVSDDQVLPIRPIVNLSTNEIHFRGE